jgi:drug/metabolite transporter (DMT)-like permease
MAKSPAAPYALAMRRTTDLSGIVAMMAATAAFVVGDSFMKLVTEDLPPFEVLFLRGIAASLACGALVVLRGEWGAVPQALHVRALLRAAGETLSVLCYVVALARMPIADVIAIIQTAPLMVLVGAACFLRERIGPARITLALVGFAGAVMVAQPGASGGSSAALVAFGSAVLVAARDLVGRGIPASIPVSVAIWATVLMGMLVGGAMSLAFETWVPPDAWHLGFLALAGLFVALGHVLLLLAYRLGRMPRVAPFFYSFALWAVVAGLLVWGEVPNALALAGIGLVVGSGIAILLIDARTDRPVRLTEAL